MVRIKNRYLLVNILYPKLESATSKTPIPDVVAFNQPTSSSLDQNVLLKAIRAQVLELFGDYGSGAVLDSLQIKYFSQATSTFILRVSRSHYQIAWAALSFMTKEPVKNGKNCVFRVVRVSGTIRKAEEEGIRRAKEIVIMARREMGEQSDSTLDNIFGKGGKNNAADATNDITMVDAVDSEDEELSDDD
ncbi:hypothetical protein HYALB_00007323 [Hymenoscyphus albidus]|uniref:Ribonuclease P/MRP protein subunit POP5 n=1 Tax=Hymenoscyphus albidus TaxID=595503 RepID=A0A9N9Q3J1_9HELO|nr:hypothetical protein HYALB_00007323 [Hymenoscyphus albidus]